MRNQNKDHKILGVNRQYRDIVISMRHYDEARVCRQSDEYANNVASFSLGFLHN